MLRCLSWTIGVIILLTLVWGTMAGFQLWREAQPLRGADCTVRCVALRLEPGLHVVATFARRYTDGQEFRDDRQLGVLASGLGKPPVLAITTIHLPIEKISREEE